VILDTIFFSVNLEIIFISILLQREKTYLMFNSSLSIKLYLAKAVSDFTAE